MNCEDTTNDPFGLSAAFGVEGNESNFTTANESSIFWNATKEWASIVDLQWISMDGGQISNAICEVLPAHFEVISYQPSPEDPWYDLERHYWTY
jgi:hypothetical protein